MLSKKYKFYLGFENNFCTNYITEKLYKYYNLDLVVVVRGINEYINTAYFESPEELAKRLKYLDSHDEEYIEILRQKDRYFALYENYNMFSAGEFFLANRYEAVPLCHMCHRLWNLDKYSKTIPDIMRWIRASKCHAPIDIP